MTLSSLTLEYPGKVIANIHVSWLDPQKVRKMIIVGSRKMVVYDDIAENKILSTTKESIAARYLGKTWTSIIPKLRSSTIEAATF